MANAILDELVTRYPNLLPIQESIAQAAETWIHCFSEGGKLMVAGNGGSAADADHITGELLKGFLRKRPLADAQKAKFAAFGAPGARLASRLQRGLPAVNLGMAPALLSAFGNDVDGELAIAQNLFAQGRPGDVFMAISTGGGAQNLLHALIAARVIGVKTILLTGNRHGACEQYADQTICAPESATFKIQELHLPIYHALCALAEEAFYGGRE